MLTKQTGIRKPRKEITKDIILVFLQLLSDEKKVSEMASTLGLSISAVECLLRRYRAGEFIDISNFITSLIKERVKDPETLLPNQFLDE